MHVLLAISLTACAASNASTRADAKQNQKEDKQHVAEAGDAADHYWRALRWGDADGAKVYLESTDEKLAFDEWLNDDVKAHKITDIEVLNVKLDAKPDKSPDKSEGEHLREATVTIRTEGYAVSDQIVHEETLDQRWYRTDDGWFVVWP